MRSYAPITLAQDRALFGYAAIHGRKWKQRLLIAWQYASEPGELQRLRNTHGPKWLDTFKPDWDQWDQGQQG